MNNNQHEEDYRRVVKDIESTRFLPDSTIEIIREPNRCRPPRHVLFDFDGTLSLVREGWPDVMIPMLVEKLRATGTSESDSDLTALVTTFVMELNGKQTIYQMIRLAEEVERRGGSPEEPLAYKQQYHDRLMQRIAGRREKLRDGSAMADEMLVPHSRELLENLRSRGAAMYVASGTDEQYVIEEARLLGLEEFFGAHVYGARDDYKTFSKAMVIERIISENQIDGDELLGFGDGYVEIQNLKAVDGTAVAVASDEAGRSGKPDPWKRDRLIGAGADLVIPDYQDCSMLLDYLWSTR